MAEYVIFADAGADLPADLCARYDIRGVPMNYLLGGRPGTFHFEDPQRKELCAAFYDALRNQTDVSTSQVNPFDFQEIFSAVLESGKDILYCCFSSGISSTWQNLQAVQTELSERFPERKLRCVDTLCAAGGAGLMALYAALNREKGMSIEDNFQWLQQRAIHMCHWFTVDDLDFLKRGGRVSPTVAFLGGKLQIKPLLVIADDGTLEVREKIRGRKAAIARLVQLYAQSVEFDGAEPLVIVGHSGAEEECLSLKEQVQAVSGEGVEVIMTELSPIIGGHTGPGMLFVCHLGKQR